MEKEQVQAEEQLTEEQMAEIRERLELAQKFDFSKYVLTVMQDCPFLCEILRRVDRRASIKIPTASMGYHPNTDSFVLTYNPIFMSGLKTSQIIGVIYHELYHLIFGHVTSRRRQPHKRWNWATDLAINSIITASFSKRGVSLADALPDGCLIPGVRPTGEVSKELADTIEKLPPMQCSEWYFERLKDHEEEIQKSGGGNGSGGDEGNSPPKSGQFDDHDPWDDVPEEIREFAEQRAKNITEAAANDATKRGGDGWGSIPSEIAEEIRKSVGRIVPWQAVLKQFIGTLLPAGVSSSIKRINRRYPYIHPGRKRNHISKLLIAMDQSGSVHDEMLVSFFGELASLTKRVQVDFVPFDCSLNPNDVETWRRGTVPKPVRVRAGGTDFNAPTNFVNDPVNRGRWDGLLIMTDGLAPEPVMSRTRRGWIIGQGCKLEFNTNEVTVNMGSKAMTGSWR